MNAVGFKPTIPAGKQPWTHTLDHMDNQVQNCMDPGRIIQDFNLQFSTYQLIFWKMINKKEGKEELGIK